MEQHEGGRRKVRVTRTNLEQDTSIQRSGGPERLVFSLSLACLSVFYGFLATRNGWFPAPFLDAAISEAIGLVAYPHFAVPRVYDRAGVRRLAPTRIQPGLTLVATLWRDLDWHPGLRLIDSEGRVLHSWEPAVDEVFAEPRSPHGRRADPFIDGAHLFPNGDVLLTIEYVGTIRLDACSNVRWTLPAGTHHSIAAAADGTFWIPATVSATPTRPSSSRYPEGYPGLDRSISQDRILHVSADGEILTEISVLDILYDNGLARYLAKGKESVGRDLTHVNDVEPLSPAVADQYPLFEAGDLLISIRNLDLVLVLDPRTLKVRWYASQPFNHQHDPDFMDDGWIGVFDNNWDGTPRGALGGGSRILAIQPQTDSTEIRFPTPSSDSFYTAIMGKWQQLANGNLLLTEAQAGRAVEVDPQGHPVWEWIAEPYDSARTVELSEATRYPFTPADVAEWPCSTPADGESRGGN